GGRTGAADDEELIHGEKLQVFGRFRLDDAPGFRVGQKVSLGVIHRSLLSEHNPTGEWACARMLASAGHNAWLFEVNPSAKWFYDWEVGAARDRRAMTHVFEVYVFYERSVPSQSTGGLQLQEQQSGSRTLYNSVQVVAVATSSAFTLVSFRRAAAQRGAVDATGSVSATTGQQQQQQRTGPSKAIKAVPPRSTPGFPDGSNRGALYSTVKRDPGGDDAFAETSYVCEAEEEEVETEILELLERPELHCLYHEYPVESGENWYQAQAEGLRVDVDVEAEDTLLLVAVAAKNLAIVYWFVCRMPLDALLPFASGIQELLVSSLGDHSDTSSAMDQSLLAADRHLLGRLLRQLGSSGASPSSSFLSSGTVVTEAAAKSTHALVEIALTLALWMLFDKDNNDEMEAFLQRSAMVLLDRDALLQSYQTWVEWLHERIDDFLYTRGWSLSRLLSEITSLVESAADEWSSGSAPLIPEHDREQLQELLTSDGDESVAGQEAFIAHVRELYISKSRLSLSALHFQVRQQQQQSVKHQSSVVSVSGSSQLSGVWLCQFESFSTQSSRLEASSALVSPSHQQIQPYAMDTLSFLWLLRQLTCVHLTFSNENSVPALLARSVFNPRAADAGSEDRCARLVLDQQHHWFRCLPSGESSVATRIGGLSFGDYVGSVARSPGLETAVDVRCYGWPTASGFSSTQEFAYCWHWQLSLDSEHSEQLTVSLTIERSESPIWDSRVSALPPLDLNTEPLSRKLELVERWTPLSEYSVDYRRLGESQ
ncbi:hypothetical protein Gpo141_00014082, partial [Globisporangium polare]